jgi:hypothetical protein
MYGARAPRGRGAHDCAYRRGAFSARLTLSSAGSSAALALRSLTSPVPESAHTIVRWSEFERGGYFAALEALDLFAEDVRAFLSGVPRVR